MSASRWDEADLVPRGVRVAAAWAWRMLLILAVLYVAYRLARKLEFVLIPVAIAILLSALFAPAVRRVQNLGLPRALAGPLVIITGFGAVIGVLVLVVDAVIGGLPDLENQVSDSLDKARDWLVNGPFHLSQSQLDSAVSSLNDTLSANQQKITSGALATASTIGEIVTGALLTVFSLIFLLHDGERIWRFVLGFFPRDVRDRVDVAGRRGFATLVGYVRATVLVAFVDAISIGIGLVIIGVPLAWPLAALVFLFSFVPIVGALVSGLLAVLVALVALGPVQALFVLLVVLAVQQIEGHVLQPFLTGRAVNLHPLAVVVAIASGVVLGGIPGALLAVPLVAFSSGFIRSLHAQREEALAQVDATDAEDAVPEREPQGEPTGAG